MHAEWHCPGVEMLSGSLGHGLPVATGIAAAFKADKKDNLVYCMVGDGELHEGSNWEALLTAAHLKLSNLVVIVDRNGQNTIGRTREGGDYLSTTKDGPGLDPLRDKFEAFGCQVRVVDGHDLVNILTELYDAKEDCYRERPLVIIANTLKGKGLSCMENLRDFHYRVPRGAELVRCLEDLKMDVAPEAWAAKPAPAGAQTVHAVAMRDRFFDALYPHFQRDKSFVLISADNGWPGIDRFAALPGQFYQVGIAEQQMVGMAAGLAMQGRTVFCYAIAPFVTTRVHEFIKLDVCAMNLPIVMLGVGAGFAYSIMSTTHHCVEDVSIMRVLPNLRIWSPSDGVSAKAVANLIATRPGPGYVRLDRGGVPDLYEKFDGEGWEPHMPGLFNDGLLQPRDGSELAIISTGYMVHRALEVADKLDGPAVYDVLQIKPFHPDFYKLLAHDEITAVVTLEEHQLAGGLGSIIAEHLADRGIGLPLLRIGVPDVFSFDLGGRDAIWERHGFDTPSLVKRISEWRESL